MKSTINPSTPAPISFFERWVYLLGRISILFAIAYVPLIFYTSTWHHYNPPKAASMQFLTMLVVVCWLTIGLGRRFVSSSVSTPAAFFGMIIIGSTMFAVNMAESIETVYFYISCLVAMVMVPKFFTKLKDFEVMTYILGLVCILANLYALSQWFNWSWFFDASKYISIHKYTDKPVSFFGNENYYADFMNMALPICLTMIFCHWRKPSQLIFFTGVTILNLITMLYVDCNASYAGFFVSIPIIFAFLLYYRAIPMAIQFNLTSMPRLLLEKRIRTCIILGIFLVSIGGTYVASVPNPIRYKLNTIASWIDVDGDNQLDGVAPVVFRLQCMAATVRKIMDVPLFGIGAGNFKVIHPLYESQLERKVLGEETLARKVHNDHLYHGVEYGLFGIIGFYWLVGLAIFAGIRSLKMIRQQELLQTEDSVHALPDRTKFLPSYDKDFYFYFQLGMMAALLTAVISTAFSQTFVIASSAAIYWIFTGFIASAYQAIHRETSGYKKPEYGCTTQELTPFQQAVRVVPAPARFAILLLPLLVLGTYNTRQIIGETWLKLGMNIQDVKTIAEGGSENVYNKYGIMFQCFDRAMERYPYQMEIFYILGRYYIDAVSAIDLAIDDDARSGEDVGLQRMAYLGLLNYSPDKRNEIEKYREDLQQKRKQLLSEGIVTLQTDIVMNPNYKWAHNNLGVLFDKWRNFSYSNQAYNRVFSVDYEQVFAHYNMGLGYLRHAEIEKANESFETSLFVDARKTEVNRFLTQTYILMNQHNAAITAADRYFFSYIREQLPDLRISYSLEELTPLIDAFNQLDLILALDEIKKFVTIDDKEMYSFYMRIAHDLMNVGEKPVVALNCLIKAEKVVPVPLDSEIYLLYGSVYFSLNLLNDSAINYEKYLRVQPNSMDVRRQLTYIYSQLDKHEEALRAFSPVMNEQDLSAQDYVTFYRLLIANNYPWSEVFPQVERAIKHKGQDVIHAIVTQDLHAAWNSFFLNDPRIKKLLGPENESLFESTAHSTSNSNLPSNGFSDVHIQSSTQSQNGEPPIDAVIPEEDYIQPGDPTTVERDED